MNLIEKFEKQQVVKLKEGRKKFPDFKAGDTVIVKYIISEGKDKGSRTQAFEGVVIAKTKSKDNYSSCFTVRKISSGIGVERNFSLHSPLIEDIVLIKKGIVRRAKIYYLRNLTGKAMRIKEKLDFTNNKNKKESKIE